MTETTDDDLVLQYARGQAAALEHLITRHWAAAYRLALRSLGDPASAEDAAQEVFIRLAQAAPRYRSGAFGPWFRTLVLNAVRNHVRQAARRRRYEDEVAAARSREAAGPEDERRLLAEEVQAHVRRLPLDVRFAVVLHFYEGRPHEEVAEVLGCPKGTASSRIRRGLERLRESLAGAGYAAAVPGLEALLAVQDPAPTPPPVPATAQIEAAAAKAAATGLGKVAAVAAALLVVVGTAVWYGAGPRLQAPGARNGESQALVATQPAEVALAAPKDAGRGADGLATPPAAPVPGGEKPAADKNSSVSRRIVPDDTLTGKPALGAAPTSGAPAPEAPAAPPPGTGRIVGRATDPEGKPVPGVDVTAFPGKSAGGMFMVAPLGGRAPGVRSGVAGRAGGAVSATGPGAAVASMPMPPRATTDADGAYAIDGVAAGPVTLLVRAPRHVNPQPATIDVPDGREVRHDLRLERGEEVTGRVVDPSGAPIEGVEVSVVGELETSGPGGGGAMKVAVGGPISGRPVAMAKTVMAEDRSATTGPDGTFRIEGFRGERLRDASARDPQGRYASWRGRFAAGMTITLEPNATIHGRVVARDGGAPIAGARVACGNARAETDAAGRFTLEGIPPGTRTVTASSDTHAYGSAVVEASSGVATEVTLELARGGIVVARVVDAATGASLEDASLHIPDVFGYAVSSDRDGAYVVSNVPPGRARIHAVATGYIGAHAEVDVPADGSRVRAEIRLARGAVIDGTLRLPAGASPDEARIMILSPANAYMNDVAPAKDGTWRASGLRPGTYSVRVMAAVEGAPGARTITVAAGETVRCDIDLERPGGATLRGTVTARSGPAPEGMVLVSRAGAGGPDMRAAALGADGTYRIAGLEAGSYDLSIEGARRRVEIPASTPEVVVNVELPRLSIAGRVVDASGAAVAGARVVAGHAAAAGSAPKLGGIGGMEAIAGDDGAFRIDGLDDAAYTVRASRSGFADATAGPVRPGGEPLSLALSRGGRVRGRVTGPDGNLAEGALFYLVDAAGNTVGAGDRPFPIGQGGELVAEDVPAGTYTAFAGIANGSFERRTGVPFDGTEMTLEMAVGPGGTIEVAVRDARTGGPLAGARVDLAFADGGALPMSLTRIAGPGDAVRIGITGNAPLQTAGDGVARRERLGPASYRVKVTAEGGREGTGVITVRDDEVSRLELTVP